MWRPQVTRSFDVPTLEGFVLKIRKCKRLHKKYAKLCVFFLLTKLPENFHIEFRVEILFLLLLSVDESFVEV